MDQEGTLIICVEVLKFIGTRRVNMLVRVNAIRGVTRSVAIEMAKEHRMALHKSQNPQSYSYEFQPVKEYLNWD